MMTLLKNVNGKSSLHYAMFFLIPILFGGFTAASWSDSISQIRQTNSSPDGQGSLSAMQVPIEEWKAFNREHGIFDETVMVPMRDGVRLSTTLSKVPLTNNLPAILLRTPYDKNTYQQLQFVMLSGYALVVQYVRGVFDSEGSPQFFLHDGWGEKQDGYDTIEWIAKQPWSNGKVGTWGPSVMGILEALEAGAKPPHLVCQITSFSAVKGYGQAVYQSGVFRQSLITGWLSKTGGELMLPIFRLHPTLDAFWSQLDIESKHSEINVPSLFVAGWYDCFEQGTIDDFLGRQTRGAEGAKGNQRLVIGPWTHVNELKQEQGGLTYPANSMYPTEITDSLNWYDYWLKGKQNGIMDKAPVTYYVMGDVGDPNAPGNVWRTASTWPPVSKEVPFYLQSGGTLSSNPPDSPFSPDSIEVNPDNPVPTLGGMNLEEPHGATDQTPIESRSDVLVFSTGVLPNPVEVIGRIKAVIYAESNLTDNDLTVRLTDVYPDGRSMLVCDGIARASFRDSYANPSPITPGQVYKYEVDLWSTALVFNKGHRIRIIVANTNSPRFEINSIYKQLGQNNLPAVAVTRIHHAKDYPSALLLPVTSEFTAVNDWIAQ